MRNSEADFRDKFTELDMVFMVMYHSHNKDGYLSFTDFNQVVETRIKILKKFEYASLVKLSKKIFSSIFGLLIIIAIVMIIIIEDKLNIKLKLFFKKTPSINVEKIDNVKKISGNRIFKLSIILV